MRQIGSGLVGPFSARLSKSGDQSILDATETVISFDTADFNNGALYSAGQPTRLTAPVAGRYKIVGHISWASNATGFRNAEIRKNGSTPIAIDTRPTANGNALNQQVVAYVSLAASDYVELRGYQNSTGALNALGAATYNTSFAMALDSGQ